MTFLSAIILGVVEGVTEFLPISSTAHQEIAAYLLQIPQSEFVSSFIIAIQLGAIASVVVLYWKRLLTDFEVLKRVVVAFLPTAIIGFVLYKVIKHFLLQDLGIVAAALVLGGIVLLFFERLVPMESDAGLETMSYRSAFLIGCIQSLAVIPGVSRSGATIVGGMFLGVSKKAIVEFSFLLAIPTMLAATGYDLLKSGSMFASGEWQLLGVGFVVAFVSAFVSVRFFVGFITSHSFSAFGVYRILVGVILLAALLW